jgi:hypothetical protein
MEGKFSPSQSQNAIVISPAGAANVPAAQPPDLPGGFAVSRSRRGFADNAQRTVFHLVKGCRTLSAKL